MSGNNQLLRKLVMSSITQLAEIAYDVGSLDNLELDLDEIDEDDTEVGASSLKKSYGDDSEKWSTHKEEGRSGHGLEGGSAGQGGKGRSEDSGSSQNGEKVSDKMKKMADNVRNTGKGDALESLLANLAVTAQYIESLEHAENNADPQTQDNTVPEAVSDKFETGEPGHESQDKRNHKSTVDDLSVKVPPPAEDSRDSGRREHLASQPKEDRREYQSSRGSIGEEILAELEEEEEEFEELDSELVREMEQHLEEALAKQLNTNGQYDAVTQPHHFCVM